MTIDEMIAQKNKLHMTYEQIAFLSGVPVGTVQKVLGGITKSPRYDTLQALEKVLSDDIPDNCIMDDDVEYGTSPKSSSFRKINIPENIHDYPRQGEYTLKDYYNLPDEQHVELIDGVFYDMASPYTTHQIIAFQIAYQIQRFIDFNKGSCIPLISPVDVQLDKDDKTMLQPDFLIVCDRDKVVKRKVYGAPDFVVEVLSKSTIKKDMQIKLNKYENAGVREFWLVDPDKLHIIVYTFGEDYNVSIYGFEDTVPVGIYDGKCTIDFKPIYDGISFLL